MPFILKGDNIYENCITCMPFILRGDKIFKVGDNKNEGCINLRSCEISTKVYKVGQAKHT